MRAVDEKLVINKFWPKRCKKLKWTIKNSAHTYVEQHCIELFPDWIVLTIGYKYIYEVTIYLLLLECQVLFPSHLLQC